MNNLSIELKEISIEGENWKLFVQTSLKDYYVSDKDRFAAICPINFKRRKKHYSIKIIAPYQNGIEIRRFNSVLEASEFIGKPHANVNISACALGKRK